MLVPRDLGFRVAALFIFVVFPAIGFVIRRKWRLAVARKEEINRLLVLASEEAARAELEATIGYTAAVPAPLYRQCPVCFVPASNRCARCKSVYYCSGKCQIIHWRQGHKDECHPPLSSFEDTEKVINFEKNTVKQPYVEDYVTWVGNDGMLCAKRGETAQEAAGSSNPVYSTSYFSVKDDDSTSNLPVKDADDAVNPSLCGKEPDSSLPEVNVASVSYGLHASPCDNGMCIDDSTSGDDSLHDTSSDSCDSRSMFDNLETTSSDRDVEQAKSSTFGNFETHSSDRGVKQTKPLYEESPVKFDFDSSISPSGGLRKEVSGETSGFSGFSTSNFHKNSTQSSPSTSGFWDGSLDSSRIRKYVPTNNAKTSSGGCGDRKCFEAQSYSQFSSTLARKCSLKNFHPQVLEERGDPSPATTSYKLVDENTLAGKESADAASQRSSTILSSERSETRLKDIDDDGHRKQSDEVSQAGDTSKDGGFPCISGRGKDLNSHAENTLQSLESKKGGSSPRVPEHPSSSSTKRYVDPALKSAQAGLGAVVDPDRASFTPSATVGLKTSMLKVVEQLKAPRLSKQSDVGRNNEKVIFPYESFVKLYNWNKVELRPCGLVNCGNSCYANAVLQCLAFTPPLTAYLLQGLHSKACTKKDWCFTCEFQRLVLKAKGGSSPVSPISILSQIQKIGSHLSNGREEDAHEFLRYAIDTMQSSCLKEAGVSASSSLDEETTLMGLTFGGYLRSKIKCSRCHGKSERQERMMDLAVEIEGDIETLEDALRKFTRTESLDGENKYHCSRCKSYEKAKKKLSILEAPNVLTIALKRFQSGKFGKLNKPIQFPEFLNLTPYMRGGSDKAIYRLYGVVVHLDIMNAAFSGHYVSYVRNAQNKWYKTDDSMVKPVEPERVLNKGAYMLFYSRCSPRAPRSIRSTIISRDLSNKIKHPEIDPSRSNGRNHILDGLPSHGYAHLGDTRLRGIPNVLESDSSSDNSSLFSQSDEVSSNTDSTRESISADDISDYIFGPFSHNSPWRHSSDSDTSSSSSSSSSPLYRKLSPLSNSGRYSSALAEPTVFHNDNGHLVPEGSGPGVGVPFLQSNSSSSNQARRLVNNSSCRGAADSKRLGLSNPSDNMKSDVNLRRSSRKKTD